MSINNLASEHLDKMRSSDTEYRVDWRQLEEAALVSKGG